MARDVAMSGEVHAVPSAREIMPCCLCGVVMMHGLVEPFSLARLIFRATERDGRAWIPVRHGGAACRDPEPGTSYFWSDEIRREAYKARRRLSALDRWAGLPLAVLPGGKP